MPEAGSVETVRKLIEELAPRVIAFDARDFKDEVIAVVQAAGLGEFLRAKGWHK